MTLRAGMDYTRQVFGAPIWASVIVFEENQAKWLYRPTELKQLGQRIIDFLVNQRLRSAFLASCDEAEASLLAAANGQRNHSSLATVRDALMEFQRLEDLYCRWYGYVWACEPVQFRSQEILEPEISALAEKTGRDPAEVIAALYAVPEESFTTEISRDMLGCATVLDSLVGARPHLRVLVQEYSGSAEAAHRLLGALKKDESSEAGALLGRLAQHVERYGWRRNNYLGGSALTEADVLAELLREAADPNTIGDLAGKLREELAGVTARKTTLLALRSELLPQLDTYERLIANIGARFGAELLDQRKKTIMIANGAFESLIHRIATGLNGSVADLRLLLPAELIAYSESPDSYTERLGERRKRFLVYQSDAPILEELTDPSVESELTNSRMLDPYLAEGEHLSQTFVRLNARFGMTIAERDAEDASALRGVVAHRPTGIETVDGAVAIVLHAREDPFEEGQILVAPSTTPDYLPAIRQARAIITDWGGQTSHAAMTARELNKPCIIGTGFATSLLKSGMKVEMDLRSGLISVSESA
jgi:phosphohistidine swiveling domain-containing protein